MLSAEEKQVGRRFRDCEQQLLDHRFEIDPPTYTVNGFIGVYRHACRMRAGVSTTLELREVYLHSPAYPEHPDVPAGRFGFLYREGRCRHCGDVALTRTGRVVDSTQRPPLSS